MHNFTGSIVPFYRAWVGGFCLFACLTAAFAAEENFPDPADADFGPRQNLGVVIVDLSPLTSAEILVQLKPGTDVAAFARAWGLTIKRTLLSDSTMHVLKAASGQEANQRMAALLADNTVVSAHLNLPSRHVPMGFTPNDPYYTYNNPSGFSGQWHLYYQARPHLDANLLGAWQRDLTGSGVIIGICDDGLQGAHPDLAPNYSAADSYDFAGNDAVPNPVASDDNHGTSVAGVAAARGNNGIGVTGAAPLARLAGLRVLGSGATDADFVDATKYHSFGANRNIKVKNHSYGIPTPFIATSAERTAFADSAAAGTIHCLSAGNERGKPGQDSNKKSIQSSPKVIVVAALGSSGQYGTYSSFGANVVVTAPSSSFRPGEFGITTTDRTGSVGYNPSEDTTRHPSQDYTCEFGGTSSSSPLVAGIMALAVQANPNLNARLVKHLLARSCDIVHANDTTESSDGGWKQNGAGFRFNQNYGFGLIDAAELTQLARQYSGVTPQQAAGHSSPVSVNAAVPDLGEVSRTFTINATTPLEEVVVYLEISHTRRGDLEAYLQSPAGTTSRLFCRSTEDTSSGGVDWSFTSHAFWGENPNGTWRLTVKDRYSSATGNWVSYQFTAYMGQPVLASGPALPTISSFSPTSGAVGARVTLVGAKLDQVTAVRFNGQDAGFTIESSTQLSTTVPAMATTGPFIISTANGSVTSSVPFTVLQTPAITSLSPNSGSAGTLVNIFGAHLAGATDVRFNGATASFTAVSANQINATVPASATSGRVTIVTSGGTATSPGNFTITTSPVISGFSPARAPIGTTVTISGANFTGATAVRFNGVNTPFTINSAQQITATVPSGSSTGPLTVVTAAGTTTSAGVFTVEPPPAITSFTPASGPRGSTVVINGRGFASATAVRVGTSNAVFTLESDTQITAIIPAGAATGKIQVATAAGTATSTNDFVVVSGPQNDLFIQAFRLSGGSGWTNGSTVGASREASEPRHAGNLGGKSIWFAWQAPSSGAWVFDTVGSGFDTLLAVYLGTSINTLNEVAANDDIPGTSTESQVQFTAASGLTYYVAVDGYNASTNNPAEADAGTVVLKWRQIVLPPVITGFTPNIGVAGTTVTLQGSNFIGTTAVRFGTQLAERFQVISDREISAVAPAGVATGPLTVTTPAGTTTSVAVFQAINALAHDNFASPWNLAGASGTVSGSTAGATRETGEPYHSGNSGGASLWFAWTAPSSGVWTFDTFGSQFDTLLAVYTGGLLTSLTPIASNDDAPNSTNRASQVTFPTVAGTTYRIALDGYVGLNGPFVLHWAPTPVAPRITGFTPGSGPAGTTVTISGENLANATSVRFGSVSSAFALQAAAGSLTAVVPAGAATGPITVTTPNGTAVSAQDFTVTHGPLNDQFASAQVLTGSIRVLLGSNIGASKEPNEPAHAGNAGGSSIWYCWTAPSNGWWTVDLSGSTFDTTLAIYRGTVLHSLAVVDSDDDSGTDRASKITFRAYAGWVYQFAVDGYDGTAGSLALRLFPAWPSIEVYSTGFERNDGFVEYGTVINHDGWVKHGSGGNGILRDIFPGGGQQAWLGYAPPNSSDSALFLWRPLNYYINTNTYPVIRFTVNMAITDSSNGKYDDFLWFVYAGGQRLFMLDFDNAAMDVFYALQGSSSYVNTGVSFQNDRIYRLSVVMNFAANRWNAFLNETPLVTGKPIATSSLPTTLADIDAVWDIRNANAAGNNLMVFDDYRVVAEPAPRITILRQPESQVVAVGGRAALGVVVAGPEPFTYQWRFNGTALPNATAPVLILDQAQPAQSGQYSCVIANSAGKVTTTTATITVDLGPQPPVFTQQPASMRAFAGTSATFAIAAQGRGPITYQWQRDGVNLANGGRITGVTTPTLRLSNLQPGDAGEYCVLARNPYGEITSSRATLEVIGGVLKVAVYGAAEDAANTDVKNKLVASGQFAPKDIDVFPARTGARVPTLAELQRYAAVLTYSTTPYANATAFGNVLADYLESGGGLVVATHAFTTSTMLNGRVRTAAYLPFESGASATGNSLSLVKEDPTHPLLEHVASFTGGPFSEHAAILPSFGATVVARWSNGRPLIAAKTTSQTRVVGLNFRPPSGSVSNRGWNTNSNGALLLANALIWAAEAGQAPVFTREPVSLVARRGSTVSFSGAVQGNPPWTFQWRFQGTNLLNSKHLAGASSATLTITNVQAADQGTYTLLVRNRNGDAISQPVTLALAVPPSIVELPQTVTTLRGAEAVFTVAATGTGPLQYQWRRNGTNLANNSRITGATSNVLKIAPAELSDSGKYQVVIRNIAGAITSTPPAVLTVMQIPTITAQPRSVTNHPGSTVSFRVTATGSAPLRYQWEHNGTSLANSARITGTTSNVLTLRNLQITDAGLYSIVVRNPVGSVTSVLARLTLPGSSALTLAWETSMPSLEPATLAARTALPPPSPALPRLHVSGYPAGSRVILESSSDLHAWSPILTNQPTEETFVWMPALETTRSQRFYRAKVE